ncbi:hypothetical protein KUW09_14395 [Mameliella alba]|nr:hypothetical protein [Antarctobacter heliothermus]MBY6145243.1 hypothetical protein [Mameliella alba]MCA0954991.1 hypothetical protein [Mameliella alba]
MSSSSDHNISSKLILTAQGKKWLEQFDPIDMEAAKLLTRSLTLISHSEFRRRIETSLLELGEKLNGVIGLYAVREVETSQGEEDHGQATPFFQNSEGKGLKGISAVSYSADQGSEAIVANIIRQISKAHPQKYLNHPTKESLRDNKCRHVIFVDDFIGSGKRVEDFLNSFRSDRTILSWLSSKHLKVSVLSYSGTEAGIARVEKHKINANVCIFRDCPSVAHLPISGFKKKAIRDLCEEYGRRALKRRKMFWWGFKDSMSTMVFEHGCPNNTPAILWDQGKNQSTWIGIFPSRTIDNSISSVFPEEIRGNDPLETMNDMGQHRLSISGALLRRGQTGQHVLLILALIAKGQRRRQTISYATGLSVQDCERLISRCIKWEFISADRRITKKGIAELNAARYVSQQNQTHLAVGSDYYYPLNLRATAI